MHSEAVAVPVPKKTRWAGWILTALPALFLLMDSVGKFIRPAPVVEGTIRLGYSAGVLLPLGAVLLACTVLYLIPRTSVLGAILLTGFLGGAVATHLRVGDPLLTHILFPVYVGVLLWGGLYLRDDRVRALIPWREGNDRLSNRTGRCHSLRFDQCRGRALAGT
jgi:hypothetical protein